MSRSNVGVAARDGNTVTLPLLLKKGHLYVRIGDPQGQLFMLDTGAPMSFGTGDEVSLLGRRYPLRHEVSGLNVARLSEFVGPPMDGLIGMDIMGGLNVVFDVPRGEVTLSDAPITMLGGTAVPLGSASEWPSGLGGARCPVVTGEINDKGPDWLSLRMLFDTGCQMSYLRKAKTEAFIGYELGSFEDFYSPYGRFTTEMRGLGLRLGTVRWQLARFGQLPPEVEKMIYDTLGIDGLIGNEIMVNRAVGLFMQQGVLVFAESGANWS